MYLTMFASKSQLISSIGEPHKKNKYISRRVTYLINDQKWSYQEQNSIIIVFKALGLNQRVNVKVN